MGSTLPFQKDFLSVFSKEFSQVDDILMIFLDDVYVFIRIYIYNIDMS